jgi:hypothetical protein
MKGLVGKPQAEKLIGIPARRWEDNINMGHKGIA